MSDIIKMGRVFWFEAAHHLPNHEGGLKYGNL